MGIQKAHGAAIVLGFSVRLLFCVLISQEISRGRVTRFLFILHHHDSLKVGTCCDHDPSDFNLQTFTLRCEALSQTGRPWRKVTALVTQLPIYRCNQVVSLFIV